MTVFISNKFGIFQELIPEKNIWFFISQIHNLSTSLNNQQYSDTSPRAMKKSSAIKLGEKNNFILGW